MSNHECWDNAKAGMAGGLIGTLTVTMHSSEIVKTIVLAAVGAIVSFGISFLLKAIVAHYKKGGK